jgi:hypothetical protein
VLTLARIAAGSSRASAELSAHSAAGGVKFVTTMEQWKGVQVSFSHTDNLLRGYALERCQTGRKRW